MKFTIKDFEAIKASLLKCPNGRLMMESALLSAAFSGEPVRAFQASLNHNGLVCDTELSKKLYDYARAGVAPMQTLK